MPVGRWGWEWARAHYVAASAAGKGWIVGVAIVGALVYVATALLFDVAYWALGRFAAGRIGRRARAGISVAFAIVVIAAISASGGAATPESTPSPGAVAAGTASHALQTPQVSPSVTPAGTPSEGVIAPSATPADGDDEAGASYPPGASFSPGSTGVPFGSALPGSPASGSAADRLPGEPDPALTPGALNTDVTQATIGSTICVSGWTATIRPPSNYTGALKIEQIGEYGYTDTSTSDYEEDHLISLELGGAPTDPRNLWPEPYTASLSDGRPTGAHTKDGFETRLKNEVCAGTISLTQAQAEIGDHWVHAYYEIQLVLSTPTAGPSATPGVSVQPSSEPSTSSGAALSVRITSLPASIKHGAYATMVAVTSPGAACSASVTYASGTVSAAKGLQTRPFAGSSGKVLWTWKVGTSTKPGISTAAVRCSLGDAFASTSKPFRVT